MSVQTQALRAFRDRWENKEALEFVSMTLLLEQTVSSICPRKALLMLSLYNKEKHVNS